MYRIPYDNSIPVGGSTSWRVQLHQASHTSLCASVDRVRSDKFVRLDPVRNFDPQWSFSSLREVVLASVDEHARGSLTKHSGVRHWCNKVRKIFLDVAPCAPATADRALAGQLQMRRVLLSKHGEEENLHLASDVTPM